jgi:hypothetical protein
VNEVVRLRTSYDGGIMVRNGILEGRGNLNPKTKTILTTFKLWTNGLTCNYKNIVKFIFGIKNRE